MNPRLRFREGSSLDTSWNLQRTNSLWNSGRLNDFVKSEAIFKLSDLLYVLPTCIFIHGQDDLLHKGYFCSYKTQIGGSRISVWTTFWLDIFMQTSKHQLYHTVTSRVFWNHLTGESWNIIEFNPILFITKKLGYPDKIGLNKKALWMWIWIC